jgi:YVTN family beta-propeller protein
VIDIAKDGTPSVAKKIGFEVAGVLPEWLQPVGVKVTSDGGKIFVALGPANRVAVIDGASLEVEDYILVGQRAWQLGFTPDEKFLLTTNGNSNDITVIDVEKGKATKSIPVGEQPWGVIVKQ